MIFDFFKKNRNKSEIINRSLIKKNSIFDTWANAKDAQGFFAVVDKLPNPDIVLKNAGKTISVLSNLENHYQVGACIESRKAGTTSTKWELNENNCPKNHFDFYKEIFDYLDIYRLIEDILDAPMYGYNPIEINWQKDKNYIFPTSLVAKPQEWFYFNSEGQFFFKDKNQGGKREIELNGFKFLLPRNKPTYKNPYGKAKLSSCFWNVAFINGGMEFWVKFAEKYAMPYMFGKYDRSMSEKEQNEFLEALSNLIQDAVSVIPSDGTVEIVNTGGTSNSAIYSDLITKCENNISKAILGQTLTTDIGASGSYAASNTHMGVREDIINSDKLLVETTINKFIKIINQINFNDDNTPIFNFIEAEDLGVEKAKRDNLIKSLGVKFNKEYITKTYGYKDDDIDIIDETTDFNDKNESINIPDSEFINLSLEKNPMNSSIQSIIDFFQKQKDAETALEKLEELYPNLDNEELEKMLAKIIYISELKGRLDVQNK